MESFAPNLDVEIAKIAELFIPASRYLTTPLLWNLLKLNPKKTAPVEAVLKYVILV